MRWTTIGTFAAMLLVARAAPAVSDAWDEGEEFTPPPVFGLDGASIGGVRPANAAPAYLTGSRIAIAGERTLVSDADSGMLLLADAAGTSIAQLAVGADAGLLVYDPNAKRAYVADRGGDRIIVVAVGDQLVVEAAWKTPAEPYGVALTPDRKTLLVATIADRTLVAFDVATGREAWRVAIDAEIRGLTIAPDGSRALASSLTSGAITEVSLASQRVARLALPALAGERARAGFAVTFAGPFAVTTFQDDTPVSEFPDGDHYGGASTPPVRSRLAWFGSGDRHAVATTNLVEPRAVAWDGAHDVLYAVGMASDHVVAVGKASQVDVTAGTPASLDRRCGADGIAVDDRGSVRVWCSFTRSIARFDRTKRGALAKVQHGPALVESNMDATSHSGLVVFHTADENVSAFGGMSCGSCHLDGRSDGVSWHIKTRNLQTPLLAGRIADSAPFKWDGTAKTLERSLRETIGRLGGEGLSKKQLSALAAFVTALPAVRTPTRNPAAIARGKRLFESNEVGCTECHDGPTLGDGARHRFNDVAFDTPGLRGLAASAPYFHDGSAPTLEAVLRERGSVHGMVEAAARLTDAEVADLVAFLEAR